MATGKIFSRFFFISIILACESLAYGILERSLIPVSPQIFDFHLCCLFCLCLSEISEWMSLCLVVQMNGIKMRSIRIIVSYRIRLLRHGLVAFQFANVLHHRKYCWFSHTSFPPIRVIYLFIFFSFTRWQSQLQIEMLMKQKLEHFHLTNLTTLFLTHKLWRSGWENG